MIPDEVLDDIRAAFDLVEFVGRDVELDDRGRDEVHGPCATGCQGYGNDRFRVDRRRQRWYCRQCTPRGGDIIAYLMARDRIDFPTGVKQLAAEAGISLDGNGLLEPIRRRASRPKVSPTSRRVTSTAIKSAALEAVERCERRLWESEGTAALAWLHDARGLSDETIKRARLGLSLQSDCDCESVPLTYSGLVVPEGITLPWIRGEEIVNLRVRTSSGLSGKKYLSAYWDDKERRRDDKLSAGNSPYGINDLQGRRTLAMVEGEFDTLLLRQEAGDLADVISLGAAGARVPQGTASLFLFYRRVLALLDGDEAGEKAASRIVEQHPTIRPVSMPEGQDITDLWRAGKDIRQLVQSGRFAV